MLALGGVSDDVSKCGRAQGGMTARHLAVDVERGAVHFCSHVSHFRPLNCLVRLLLKLRARIRPQETTSIKQPPALGTDTTRRDVCSRHRPDPFRLLTKRAIQHAAAVSIHLPAGTCACRTCQRRISSASDGECPLNLDKGRRGSACGRGLHSFTSQLNLSDVYGVGAARRGYIARVKGVSGSVQGVLGVLCVSDAAQVELKSERV